jgi:hypothetical protein
VLFLGFLFQKISFESKKKLSSEIQSKKKEIVIVKAKKKGLEIFMEKDS